MTIEKYGFEDYEIYCDYCDGWLNIPWGCDFQDCVEEAKREGWLIRKDRTSGQWEHICPKCQ